MCKELVKNNRQSVRLLLKTLRVNNKKWPGNILFSRAIECLMYFKKTER